MQPNDPQFQPPNAAPAGDPRGRVSGPAIGLIITGVVGILNGLINIFARSALMAMMASNPQFQQVPMANMNAAGGVVGGIIALATSAFVIFGALQMQKLQSYGLAIAATIVAMIPCFGPCCCIGIPIGIWSLIVLMDANVKASFVG